MCVYAKQFIYMNICVPGIVRSKFAMLQLTTSNSAFIKCVMLLFRNILNFLKFYSLFRWYAHYICLSLHNCSVSIISASKQGFMFFKFNYRLRHRAKKALKSASSEVIHQAIEYTTSIFTDFHAAKSANNMETPEC